jgi:TRAP-type C4-dicarboxylate transport system permease small subunit
MSAPRGFALGMHRLFSTSAVILIPAMTVLITADTALRYMASMPLVWAQDVAGLLLLLVFACALPYSWPGGFHVRMDMLYDRMPKAWRRGVDVITELAAFIIGAILAHQGVLQTIKAFENTETTPATKVVIWPFAAAIAVCAALFCVVMVVQIVGVARGQLDAKEDAKEDAKD